MKYGKKFFICTVILLILFLCINAISAEEQLNESLKTDVVDDIGISDISDEKLESHDICSAGSSDDNDSLRTEDSGQMNLGDRTIYVSEYGDDANDGSSEQNAVQSISRAVEIANSTNDKASTIYFFNGDYTTSAIDIVGLNLTFVGQQMGEVIIHGEEDYIFKVDGSNLTSRFENIDFADSYSSSGNNAALRLYADYSDFIINNCTFRDISAKYGALDFQGDYGTANITNCVIENVRGSTSMSAIVNVNGASTFNFDKIEISNCRMDDKFANDNPASYLRAIVYVNSAYATVTLTNSNIHNNRGPMYGGIIESRSKLTVKNTFISNNVVNTSVNGNNGGEYLIFASHDNSDIDISHCVITCNVIAKSGKALFYNNKAGSINVEYCDISNNRVDDFILLDSSSGTITADNNWWAANDQPDSKVGRWVIMNVELDDSNLAENNQIILTIDFNHIKTSSGNVEELSGGEIPRDSYSISLTAKNGEIAPTNIVVNKGEVKTETFTVTSLNDEITLNCDGDVVNLTIEGIESYKGIIYVDKTGDDGNNGSVDAPVLSVSKAIELADRGCGQIMINEGTYKGNMYHVTKSLNVTGVGNVILDADNARMFTMSYGDSAGQLILSNLTITGANDNYGQAIYSFADELILDNVKIKDNPGSGSLIVHYGKLTMNNCHIANHNGGDVLSISTSADMVINNTVFENNFVGDNAVIYSSSMRGNLIIANSTFRNNDGKLGIVKVSKDVVVSNSRFINNTNRNSYGGAINDFNSLTVTDCLFIANKAARNAGAVNVGYGRTATITKSVFINNTAGVKGDAISNTGKLTVNYCIFLTNSTNPIIYTDSEDEANALYNWWGTNDNPESLNEAGKYYDGSDEEAESELDVSRWVVMNVMVKSNESMTVGDSVEITVDFNSYIDSTNILNDLSEHIPDLNVTAGAVNGNFDDGRLTTSNGIATFTYNAVSSGADTITVRSGDATKMISIDVISKSAIYVSQTGSDENSGLTAEDAVATIEHAMELADSGDGKIIILSGEYMVNSLLNVTKNLEIVGEGDVTVKSNSRYSVAVWDDWEEDWTYETHYILIQNNANLKLSNIKFTIVSPSQSEQLINNNAMLYINNCEFTNIRITTSKGVIQNAKGAKLEVNGTTFKSASSTYGAINNNGEMFVNNSRFIDNDRSGDGGVYSTAITSYNRATISNSVFKNNKGTAGGAIYVMYSYTNKENPVMEISNCIFEENQAAGTSYSAGTGAAIKCSGKQVTLAITNSTFIKNTASGNGGAIYAEGNVTVDECIFKDNSAAIGEAIYVYGGNADIKNSIILEDGNALDIKSDASATANDNWWGVNDRPSNVADEVTIDRYVEMTADFTPYDGEAGDEVTVTAAFDNDRLPDGAIIVTFTSSSGRLNKNVVVRNGRASTTYVIDANDISINAISTDANVTMLINVPLDSVIYVSPTGDDANDGKTKKKAFATIEHAYDVVSDGGVIYLLSGEYVCSGLILNKSVSFVGHDSQVDFGNNGLVLNGSQLDFISFANVTFVSSNPSDAFFLLETGGLNELNISDCKFYVQNKIISSGLSDININLYRNYFKLSQAVAVDIAGNCNVEAHNNIFDGKYSTQTNPISCHGTANGNMDYNYYATNERPADGSIPFTYWVIATLTVNKTELFENEELKVIIDFKSCTDGNSVASQRSLIPDYLDVTFDCDGDLTVRTQTIENGEAATVYSSSIERNDVLTVEPTSLSVEIRTASHAIFVRPGASDDNPGTRTSPVGTIAKALELAASGQIVLLEGTHKTGDLGLISDNLNITGEGEVIIDAGNNNRILYVGSDADVVIRNVVMVNGYTIDESGGLLGNSNKLTLINCTLANSSAGQNNGGAIFSVGYLTLINTTFSNCNARLGGAIYVQTDYEDTFLYIADSIFENNVANGRESFGGGAIYAQRATGFYELELTINNTRFTNNRALTTSCGGAIALEQLDATAKITNCQFISNHANGKDSYGGGAISTTSASSYYNYGRMTISDTLFENNTCDSHGGAIYARVTTVTVSNSVFINNSDADGLDVYGHRSDSTSPSITLNDNWWGSNDSPKGRVGGNRYSPTLNRWAVLTVANDTPILSGNTVRLTLSINSYTTGSVNGTLSRPINVEREAVIKTSSGDIIGTLHNGEFICDYYVPDDVRFILATVDGQTEVLYAMSSPVTVQMDDISCSKFDRVSVLINVTSIGDVNSGNIELFIGDEKIATFEVKNSQATGNVLISKDMGEYVLTARYVGGAPLFEDGEATSSLTVNGVNDLTNATFFNFFDEEGNLRDEFAGDELTFNGDFSGLGISTITIPRPISIFGNDARLYDLSLKLSSDDISVSDMSFTARNVAFEMGDWAVVSASGENIELANIFINYTAPNHDDAYAIFASSANGFKLTSSTIVFDSDNAGAIHHALHVQNSENINISGNVIDARLPAMDVDYHTSEPYFDSLDQERVLAIGIQGCRNGILAENKITVATTAAKGVNPTVDSVAVYDVYDFEISWNNITHTDTVNAGQASFSNALDLYAFDGLTVRYNNILVNTTSGIKAKGTAYPIQATGPYGGLIIDHNNLTSVSNGPALAIYSQNYDGITDITVTFNNIDVTGVAYEDDYALVSGMELQDTVARVYNNTIHSQSKGSYDDLNSLYGISYAQYTQGTHKFDIRDNWVITQGRYAVYLKSAKDSNVIGNALYAHQLTGDSAVNIYEGANCTIEDNRPKALKLNVSVENITFGQNVTVNIILSENVAGLITVLVNNETVFDNVDVEFVKSFVLCNLTAGDYEVHAIFKSGDLDYCDCEATAVFNVARFDSELKVDFNDTLKVGDNQVIAISIPDSTGNVTVVINGREETVYLVGNGSASYVIENVSAGEHNVSIIYNGDANHKSSNVTFRFIVEKFDANIRMEVPSEIKVGQTVVINVTGDTTSPLAVSIDGENVDVSGGKVSYRVAWAGEHIINVIAGENGEFKMGNVTQTFNAAKNDAVINLTEFGNVKVGDTVVIAPVTNIDGELTIKVNGEAVNGNYTVLSNGTFVVTVESAETEMYYSGFANATFIATKYSSSVNVSFTAARAGDVSVIHVNVTGGSGGNIIVNVNGTEHPIDVADGKLELTLNAGQYPIFATYMGDYKFERSVSETKTLTVLEKMDANIGIDVLSEVKVGQNITINVTWDTTSPVVVSIDGVNVSVADGKVSYYVAKAGEHIVNAFAGENGEFKKGNVTRTFNASKNDAVINLTEFKNVKIGDVIVIAPATNSDGELTVKVNGEVVNGNYTVPSNGTYVVTAETAETEMYNQGFAFTSFVVFKDASSINVMVYPARALNESFAAIEVTEGAGGNVTVKLDGNLIYNGFANQTSIVSLGNLTCGNHTVAANYLGDRYLNESADIKQFMIFKSESHIQSASIEINEGETAKLIVKVNSDATGNVSAEVNRNNYSAAIADGSAVISIPGLKSGAYDVLIRYDGDERYDAGINTTSVMVKRVMSADEMSISLNAAKESASEFTIRLPSDAKGNLTVIVDGKEKYSVSLVNGAATVAVGKLSDGKHSIQVIYSGDGNYSGISKSTVVNVKNPAVAKKKIATKFVAKKKTFKVKTKVKKYRVVLKTKSGKAVKNVKVTLKIRGKTYKAKTNSKGKAVFKIKKLTKKGKFKAVLKFKGNKTYRPTSKKVKISVK